MHKKFPLCHFLNSPNTYQSKFNCFCNIFLMRTRICAVSVIQLKLWINADFDIMCKCTRPIIILFTLKSKIFFATPPEITIQVYTLGWISFRTSIMIYSIRQVLTDTYNILMNECIPWEKLFKTLACRCVFQCTLLLLIAVHCCRWTSSSNAPRTRFAFETLTGDVAFEPGRRSTIKTSHVAISGDRVVTWISAVIDSVWFLL